MAGYAVDRDTVVAKMLNLFRGVVLRQSSRRGFVPPKP